MRGTRLLIAALVVVMLASGAALVRSRTPHAVPRRPAPSGAHAPDGARVRVQVLNGTPVRGLARRATMVLRDRGFDVVETGTVSSALDTTLVLDLSGHPDWARRVARVLAPARVEARTDSSRYLDIAVVLGSAWRPPSEPFYP